MSKKTLLLLLFIIPTLTIGVGCTTKNSNQTNIGENTSSSTTIVVTTTTIPNDTITFYSNPKYGFNFTVNKSCEGWYKIVEQRDSHASEILNLYVLKSKQWSVNEQWFSYGVLNKVQLDNALKDAGKPIDDVYNWELATHINSKYTQLKNGYYLVKFDPQDGPSDIPVECHFKIETESTKTVITYYTLSKPENKTNFCDGANMDSAGYKTALTKQITVTLPENLTIEKKIIKTLSLGANAEQYGEEYTNIASTTFKNGIVTMYSLNGWAGSSIFYCSWKPFVEKNLEQFSEVKEIRWTMNN